MRVRPAATLVLLILLAPQCVQANTTSRIQPFTDELSEVTLRHPRAEVLGTYFAMTEANWHDIYHSVSAEFQLDLWTAHLTRALVEIPDLSVEQRGVILQAIGLVTTGVVKIDRGHPDWERLVHEPLQALEHQALLVFELPVGRAIFTELQAESAFHDTRNSMIQKVLIGPECTCSTESDWCAPLPTQPGKCKREGTLLCRPRQGCCGFLLKYDCDGVCV